MRGNFPSKFLSKFYLSINVRERNIGKRVQKNTIGTTSQVAGFTHKTRSRSQCILLFCSGNFSRTHQLFSLTMLSNVG